MSVARSFSTYVPWHTFNLKPASRVGILHQVNDVVGGTSYAIAVGHQTGTVSATAIGRISYTSDGKVWSSVSTTSFGNNGINGVAYGNGTFLAVGFGGLIATASESAITTWTQRTPPVTLTAWGWCKFIDGKFWITGSGSATLYYSTDGITWNTGATMVDSLRNATNPISTNQYAAGDLFYLGSSYAYPWIGIHGKPFTAGATYHYSIMISGATSSSGTVIYPTNTNTGSQWPLHFPEDNRFLVKTINGQTDGNGFHQQININVSSVTTGNVPVGLPEFNNISSAHMFFPAIWPKEPLSFANGTSFAQINTTAYTQGNGSDSVDNRTHYVFNDGYYNAIFSNQSLFGLWNVPFSADSLEISSSPQIIGKSRFNSNNSFESTALRHARWTKFKGMTIGIASSRESGTIDSYYLGTPTIRTLGTTTSYK